MSDRISIEDLPLPGLKLIVRNDFSDHRGILSRLYCRDTLGKAGITDNIQQINLTKTYKAGVLRGMHYQLAPYTEDKIITCLKGRVFDVAVDLRKGSPSYLKWYAQVLSPELRNAMVLPKGFAHGFQSLTDDCELLYLHTAPYIKESEGGLSPFDPVLNILWPYDVTDISERDQSHSCISTEFAGLTYEM